MFLHIALVTSLGSLLGLTSATPTPTPVVENSGQSVFVKVKIKREGKTLTHPGHKMETGEEVVLVLTEGKREHEVTLFVDEADDGFQVEASYVSGGKKVLEGEAVIKGKTWRDFKSADGKTVVSVNLNPGASRQDKVELPGSRDPLEGVK